MRYEPLLARLRELRQDQDVDEKIEDFIADKVETFDVDAPDKFWQAGLELDDLSVQSGTGASAVAEAVLEQFGEPPHSLRDTRDYLAKLYQQFVE